MSRKLGEGAELPTAKRTKLEAKEPFEHKEDHKRTLHNTTSSSTKHNDHRFNEDDLKCRICFEFPAGSIYQCHNGHLLCEHCHFRIVESAKSQCPCCRIRLSRDHPSRNMFAESVLANVVVSCEHNGCDEKIQYSQRKAHEQKCLYKKVCCKYAPLACDWVGCKRDESKHRKECKIKKLSAKKLLKLVKEKDSKSVTASSRISFEKGGSQVMDLLSSRVRDITIRDVVLERDEICGEISSSTFLAFNYAWEVILERYPKGSNQAALKIRMVSSLRKKLKISFFILKGPYVDWKIPPSVHVAEFRKRRRNNHSHSHICPLQVDEATSKKILSAESIHLRIGFVDRSPGVSRYFTNNRPSSPPEFSEFIDSEEYSSSSSDDDSELSSELYTVEDDEDMADSDDEDDENNDDDNEDDDDGEEGRRLSDSTAREMLYHLMLN